MSYPTSDSERTEAASVGGSATPLGGTPLSESISQRTAGVGVVGMGYVGLPNAIAIATAGFNVTGIDISQGRVDQLNGGQSYIEDVQSSTVAHLVNQGKLIATTDSSAVRGLDVIVICVPTPVNKNKEPELGPLRDAVHELAKHMHTSALERGASGRLVILQSTSFPGTTEEIVLPLLQRPGHEVGKEFYLAFSPERIDPGNQQYAVHNTPKVVGGVTPRCNELAAAFFATHVKDVIAVSSPKIAEMTKLLENIFRSVNIALVNELSELCRRMNLDIWEVIHAATTKPFGYMPFYPGIGVGGHCIPVDPFYLSWKAKEYDFYVNFIELAARTNDNMPYSTVTRIVDILGDRGEPVRGSHLLLLGVSFKKDIGDTRNSPALRVAELLAEKGAHISFSDRHVPEATIGGYAAKSVEPDEATLREQDATIILVDHSYYNLEEIVRHSRLVIDTRDATRPLGSRQSVVKL